MRGAVASDVAAEVVHDHAAPGAASSSVWVRPMPLPAPVTITARPSSATVVTRVGSAVGTALAARSAVYCRSCQPLSTPDERAFAGTARGDGHPARRGAGRARARCSPPTAQPSSGSRGAPSSAVRSRTRCGLGRGARLRRRRRRLPADCERAVATAIDRYGRLDVLVNCAGVRTTPHFIRTHRVSEAEWDNVMDTNVKGTFFCCRSALVHMKRQQHGVIINISSKNAIRAICRARCVLARRRPRCCTCRRRWRSSTQVTTFACSRSRSAGVHTDMASAGGVELRRLLGDPDAAALDPEQLDSMPPSAESVARTFQLAV